MPQATQTNSPQLRRRSKIYFLSDLHLGARYFSDPKQAERDVVAFLTAISADAKEIYLLGDVLDYWYEYRYVVPRGFVRFFGKLAELSDMGIRIIWMKGNHDIWIFDYLPAELGIEIADGTIERDLMGKRFYLAHGDGVGHQPPVFRMMRKLFRNRFAQWLYSGIHPRWTIPFALRWSCGNRSQGADTSAANRGAEALQRYAAQHSANHPGTDFYIFGHVHIQSRRRTPSGAEAVTLGGWLGDRDYAVWDGQTLRLENFNPPPGDTLPNRS